MNTPVVAILAAQDNSASLTVALAIIGLIAIITVVAVLKYQDVDSVLKIWGALGTLSGLVAGTMATYFFTKGEVEAKDSQIKTVQTALTASEKEKVQAGNQIQTLIDNIKPAAVTQGHQDAVAKLEDVSRTLKDTSTISPPSATAVPSPSVFASPP